MPKGGVTNAASSFKGEMIHGIPVLSRAPRPKFPIVRVTALGISTTNLELEGGQSHCW